MKPFDASGAFQPSAEGGVRRLAVRGAGVTVFSQGVIFLVQMLSTVVLGRLLTPSDFGVVIMVTTFSLLLMSFGVNGYAEAIMQRKEMDHVQASNLFWINIGAGIFLTALFAVSGPLLAKFYGDRRLIPIAAAISSTIFVSQTSVVHLALLKRALRFNATSANEVVSNIVSVAVSIIFALAGWGYWALAIGLIARPISQAFGAWCLCRWMPGLPRRTQETGSIVTFAAHVYGRFSFNYFARNTDNLLVGWRFGSSPLGFYKKAYDLFVLPANQLLSPVSDVVLSTLSRLERGSAEYKRFFLDGLSILAFVGMAAGGILTIAGKDFIRLILGAKWGPAGQIFTFFGPGVGIMMIYTTSGLIHLSIGRADRWLRWVIVEFVVTVLLFVAGLHWGPVGVASAWTVSFWILTIPAFWYAGRPIRFGVAPVIAVTWRYAIASLISGGLSFEIMQRLVSVAGASGVMGALARIITASFLFLTFYIAAVIAFYGGPAPVYRLAKIMPDLLPLGSLRRSLSKRDSAVPEDIRKGESVFEKVERLPDEAGQDRVTELR